MKKMLSMILALSLIFALSIPAGAAEVAEGEQGLTKENIAHVEEIFNREVRVIDENGEDITESFLAENAQNYETGDYAAILDCLIEDSLSIEELTGTQTVETRGVVNGSFTSSIFIKYCKSPVTGETSKEWIRVKFKCVYAMNDYNNTFSHGVSVTPIIVETSSSTLKKSCEVTSFTAKGSNNGKTVTFNINYNAIVTVVDFGGGLGLAAETPGTAMAMGNIS